MVSTRSSTAAKANGYEQPNGNGAATGKQPKKRVGADDLRSETKRPKLEDKTDRTRWRMQDEKGRHTWHYLEDDEALKEWPQSTADKYYLGLDTVCRPCPPFLPFIPLIVSSANAMFLLGTTCPAETEETS